MPQRRIILVFALFVLGAAAILAATLALLPDRGSQVAQATQVGGPFELVDQDGRMVNDTTFHGTPMLVFFGFTHCPDICPTTLADISQLFDALGPDSRKVAALFITVDPERDTPDVMKSYISSFHPSIFGLSGTPQQTAAALKAYRGYARKVPTEGGDYTMDHTAVVYLMDKDGNFVAPFNLKRPVEQSAAELRRYL
ncbi:SCO family protein [Ancylobacter sp. 6x-1]|uniref:SCO family protein n=1 Tax=Ancylobacter crimeensis TaxID=2579147 RepID=A0ABT0D941_9HYPH|nr:SCO family protein [Ancylobacter crimeensis]MCK0196462.1 SCO family protein [Ancylobacter crimeensis]